MFDCLFGWLFRSSLLSSSITIFVSLSLKMLCVFLRTLSRLQGLELVEDTSVNLFRRDFQCGIVLLNGEDKDFSVNVGSGFARIVGTQAPKWQYTVDDNR